MSSMKHLIAKIANAEDLSQTEAREAFNVIMSGDATPSQIGGFLMGLRVKGETIDEIVGAVKVMREKMVPVSAPASAIDIVGTGGDGSGSFNISTCAAIVASACGVSVAKHGNRALSSRSGAADTLAMLGVNIEASADEIGASIADVGIGFMFAPAHHTAMRFVGPSRVELGTRTIFNLLGPMANPAGVKRQLMGVFSKEWVEPLAHVLNELGSEHVWVVHGSDGMDELTVTGPSFVTTLENGTITSFEVHPDDAGLKTWPAEDLKGGDAEANAKALRAVLDGAENAYRDAVLLNAAAGLIVAGKVSTLREGSQCALEAISSGRAKAKLAALADHAKQPQNRD